MRRPRGRRRRCAMALWRRDTRGVTRKDGLSPPIISCLPSPPTCERVQLVEEEDGRLRRRRLVEEGPQRLLALARPLGHERPWEGRREGRRGEEGREG